MQTRLTFTRGKVNFISSHTREPNRHGGERGLEHAVFRPVQFKYIPSHTACFPVKTLVESDSGDVVSSSSPPAPSCNAGQIASPSVSQTNSNYPNRQITRARPSLTAGTPHRAARHYHGGVIYMPLLPAPPPPPPPPPPRADLFRYYLFNAISSRGGLRASTRKKRKAYGSGGRERGAGLK